MSDPPPDDPEQPDDDAQHDNAESVSDVVAPEDVDASVVAWVVAGAAVFALLSLGVPMAYHASQPASNYFSAEEPTVTALNQSDPCTFRFDVHYWARESMPVVVDTTLYERTGEGLTERQHWRNEGYLDGGVHDVTFTHTTDAPLSAGTYQFGFLVAFEAPHGIDKVATVDSEPVVVEYVSAATANETEAVVGRTGAILFREDARC